MEKYNTCGVDIVVTKNIPIGAGLGGSSADIAGVLNGMQKLYPGEYNLFNLANYLGSDSGYMLNGGFAVIEGRGDIVKPVSVAQKMYFIILTAKNGVSARDSYKNFDKLKTKPQSITDKALEYLNNNELEEFKAIIKNDLYTSSAKLEPEILSNIYLLKKAGVDCALMTGSGSAVFGLFFDKKERDKIYNKLKPICADAILKAESI
jgi:4-diphosphocytidyl-2-C-methyl-D-erythritol kinase